MKKLLLIAGALSASLLLAAAPEAKPAKGKAPAGFRRPVPSVLVAKAAEGADSTSRKYVGKMGAFSDATVVARVTGNFEKQLVPDGAMVKKGQQIIQLEETVYRARVLSGRALVAQTQAELDYAKSNYDRQKQLYSQKAAAKSAFEEAQKLYLTTKAKLSYYRALLIEAEDSYAHTKVRAPFDGRIGKVMPGTGDYMNVGTTLFTIVTINPVKVEFAISTGDFLSDFGSIEKIKKNGQVSLELADGTTYPLKGKVTFVDNKVDTNTDTLMVRALFDNPQEKLIPGGLLTVHLGKAVPNKLPAVPVSAVMNDPKGSFLYVVGPGNMPEKRYVKLGNVVNGAQLVLQNLKKGETVIIEGANKVMPGMAVNPVFRSSIEGGERK